MLKPIYFSILLSLSLITSVTAAPNIDSTKFAQALKDIEKLEKKVKEQDDKVEQVEASNKILTWVGIPTAAISIILLGWNYFWGIRKKLDSELASETTKAKVKELVEKAISKETDLKNKPIYVVFSRKTNRQDFVGFLENQKGFKTVKPVWADEDFTIGTNDVVVFNNEQAELTDAEIKNVGLKLQKDARFFYFNSTYKRWEDASVKMIGFASTRDTLEQRLLETLKN